jgi:hypothetical protein
LGSLSLPEVEATVSDTLPGPTRRRHEQPQQAWRALYRLRRLVYPFVIRSLTAALAVWVTSVSGGVFAFVFGAITGPAELRAMKNGQTRMQLEFAQAEVERKETRDWIIWLAQKECQKIPFVRQRFDDDSRACRRVDLHAGTLFTPNDSTSGGLRR